MGIHCRSRTAPRYYANSNWRHRKSYSRLVECPNDSVTESGSKDVKGDSSYGIRREFEGMSDFGWQDGYGVFSVSRSAVPDVVDYIVRQRDHHSTRSFEEEYVRLLENHGIDYDDKYLFD
ncbi:MAG: transposase [Chloracidobacterium sp.]|nr:transposase [Chloracidobacterium sp.]